MGGTTLQGLLASPAVAPANVMACTPHSSLDPYGKLGARTTRSNAEAARWGDVVMLFVKPWLVQQVLQEIKPVMDYSRQLLVVCAAGVPGSTVLEWAEAGGQRPQALLVMPNIAIAQRASMTFLANVNAEPASVAGVKAIFDQVGSCLLVAESQFPAATALASCGIAYAMRYVRAASEGGVELGFKASQAQQIVMQTMQGAVAVLQSAGLHPEAAIDLVTTPGGITIKGLNEMEHAGFTSAVIRGLKASAQG